MKHKIFESKKYPQGDYGVDRVKKIFSKVKEKINGVFMHTTKTGGKNIQLADFENLEIIEKDGKAEVYADIKFNEVGQMMYDKGMFSGVSVEIPNDQLEKIALLPIGINPAVSGAEFQEEFTFISEFQDLTGNHIMQVVNDNNGGGKMPQGFDLTGGIIEQMINLIGTMGLDGKMKLIKAIKDTITDQEKEAARAIAYEFAKHIGMELKEPEKIQTKEEIRAEFEKEYSDKEKAKEFVKKHFDKIPKEFSEKLEIVALGLLKDEDVIVEFSETDKKSMFSYFDELLDKMPKKFETKEILEGGSEFEEKDDYKKGYEKAQAFFKKK